MNITRTLPTALLLLASAVQADPGAGDKLVKSQCLQCHTLGRGEPHGVGPNLFGLIGRKAAAVPGFAFSDKYSIAMKGQTWDAALLDRWLKDTQEVAPGNGMTYFQDDARKRKLLVTHFQTLK